MSYAKSLKNALNDKNGTLFGRLAPIEEKAKGILIYTASKFPYYTPHDFFLHSRNVEENLNWLIPDGIKLKMNDHEIFFLLVAAWLHDWGLVARKDENEDEVRKLHHIRTEENFERFYDKIHLSLSEARIIGRICRGHREENLYSSDYRDSFIGNNILIRVSFLAALLRIADECDVTANRTPELIYFNLKPEGASDEEFRKLLSIQGIGQLDQFPYKIILNGVAYTPKGVEVIEGVKRKIQMQLDSVKTILATNGIVLDIIETQIDTRGFINKPIAFELDRKAIVNLLIGHALYSREDTAIRELFQNAIDTCRFRKTLENNYQPLIEIEFDNKQFTFKDNGIGMSFEDASSYFSKKGSTFYISKDFKDALGDKKFDPIGKFGIGVLSSFLIADNMVVHTKKKNCAPCKFSISDLAEGWKYEEGAKQDPGTEIIIFLTDLGKKVDVTQSVKHFVKNIEIPVTMKNITTGEIQTLQPKWDFEVPEVIAKIDKDFNEGNGQIKPKLSLTSTTPNLEITYHIFDDTFFESDNCFITNQGIYVGNFQLFPSYNHKWIALINLKSNLVDLTVSREDLVRDDKFKIFLGELCDCLISSIKVHIDTKFPNENELNKSIRLSAHLNRFFVDAFGVGFEGFESIIPLKLLSSRNFPVLNKEGLTFMPLGDIIKKNPFRVYHYKLPISYYEENIDLVRRISLPRLRDDELIVFDPGPHFLYVKSPRKFICAFCDISKAMGIKTIECLELEKFLSSQEFLKTPTTLDSLIPSGSFFSHLPPDLRSIVIQIKPFEFSSPLDKVSSSYAVERSHYHDLVAKELLNIDAEVNRYYDSHLSSEIRDLTISSVGQFVFDIDDQFISLLASKANIIQSSAILKKLCERYFRLLAVYYLSRMILGNYRHESVPLTLLEKIIAEMLDYKDYLALTSRSGKLASVYNYD